MADHSDSVPRLADRRVAFDVASSRTFRGAANQEDIRYSCRITVPELPMPLTFHFVLAEQTDGSQREVCVGFDVGAPISRHDAASGDPGDYEVTMARLSIVNENFHRYRQLAEDLLIPTPESVQAARRTRAAMGRRRSQRLTDDYLVGVVAEWRSRRGEADAMYAMAAARGINRVTVRRQLENAERRGLVPEGLPRRHSHDRT